MSDPYIGEIKLFAFPFAPVNWSFCNGASLAIRQQTSLFALIGTQFGGDGATTFQLPNLASRMMVGSGQGTGLSPRSIGAAFGEAAVTLQTENLPAHSHSFQSFFGPDVTSVSTPANGYAMTNAAPVMPFSASAPNSTLATAAVTAVGGGNAHPNQQPTLGLSACMAMMGTWPEWD